MSMLKGRCLLPKIAMVFWDILSLIIITLSCEFRSNRAGSQWFPAKKKNIKKIIINK
jgi:hypothetical protein